MNSQAQDLRTFLQAMRQEMPEQIVNISEEVLVDYTSTAMAFALERRGRTPILFFERLRGYDIPMVANIFASRQVMARGIGVNQAEFNAKMGACLDALRPTEHVAEAAVQEVIWQGDEVDLGKLPIPRHFGDDAGAYVTAGMIAARDPDTGIGNLAYARLQAKGAGRMGASLHSRQHLWDYHRRAEMAGKHLPVAVIIGAHPAVMIAAAAKMAIDEDEYDLAGALLGQPLRVCRARSVDVDVPAEAEIVIEGLLLAGTQEPEGPFGEYTGYTTGRSTNNVLEVTAITLRRDPIFVDIIPGNSAEHLNLGHASKEAWLHKRMKEALPFVVDFHYPSSGTHFHCYIRIDKSAEGQAMQAAELLTALDHYVKLAIVVDKDIDPGDSHGVMWALATRMQADKDINILSRMMCNRLDPSSQDGIGAKMLIDATQPLDMEAKRIYLPQDAEVNAERLMKSLGLL